MERFKAKLRHLLAEVIRWTAPRGPSQTGLVNKLLNRLAEVTEDDALSARRAAYMERVSELIEAREMAGSGPWRVGPATLAATDRIINGAMDRFGQPVAVRESANAITAQGVYGDIELALQNVEWRREVNLSWLEFSRWGIQQLILICRLYYVKHPWIRRGINLSAAYVFGQGFELSSPDPDANDVLTEFCELNKCALGQTALVEQEKRKSYDGNLFWALFTDSASSGEVRVRLIDATEIQEIVYNPDDATEPWYYRRIWTQRIFDITTGQYNNTNGECWYPALGYKPKEKGVDNFAGIPVMWDSPVLHRKCGAVANWSFGCPRVYPAIDWSKEGRKHLEACASVTQAQAQIALSITTKGGQQALAGVKQQMGTTVGPTSALWDQNPPAVAGSTFASGPGTKLEAFKTRGTGTDPSEVKEYRNMAACAMEIPPTWLADMETSNLATATTLDRPTELGFLLKQEEWQEDLVTMGCYALAMSKGAPSGKLREKLTDKREGVSIREAKRVVKARGHWVYEAAKKADPKTIEVLATFPTIREGDIPLQMKAIAEAMTLENKGGQIVGIDEKAGILKLSQLADLPNPEELVEKMYPTTGKDKYDPNRTKEPLTPPIGKATPTPGGQPQPQPNDVPKPQAAVEAQIREVLDRIEATL